MDFKNMTTEQLSAHSSCMKSVKYYDLCARRSELTIELRRVKSAEKKACALGNALYRLSPAAK